MNNINKDLDSSDRYISDIKSNLEEIEKDLSGMISDTVIIKEDLESINLSMTEAINNSAWIRNMSAVFITVIAVLMAILAYQLIKLGLIVM